MKVKKILTYIVSGALCCAMLAGLAACGGKSGDSPEAPGKQGGKAEETPAPEFVYAPEYVDVKADLTTSFDNMLYYDGRFLTSSYVRTG